MPFLLGPLLAQMVSLAVGERTEGRAIFGDDQHYEVYTRPNLALNLRWRRSSLSFGYGTSLTVTPLDSEPHQYLVSHSGGLSYTYRWKLTTVSVGESAAYGKTDFRTLALTDPNGLVLGNPAQSSKPVPIGTFIDPTTGAPVSPGARPGTAQLRASDRIILFQSSTTNLSVTRRLSAAAGAFAYAAYVVSGAVGSADSTLYPQVKGPTFGGGTWYRLSGSDAVTTGTSAQYAISSNGPSSWILALTTGWAHRLDPHTNTQLGVGVSGTRTPDPSGLTAYSIYPTFNAGIVHVTRVAEGMASLGFTVSAAPVLDLVTAAVDPRVSFGGNLGWSRRKFSVNAGLSTALSVNGAGSSEAFSSFAGSAGLGYRLAKAVAVDGGVRGAYQRFQGATTLPFSYAFFVGLTFGGELYSDQR